MIAMNAPDVLRYGHLTLLGTIERVPHSLLREPGACGVWSIDNIIAHLASYEVVLLDILRETQGAESSPDLDRYRNQGDEFNDNEVAARSDRSHAELLDEINEAHATSLDLIAGIPEEILRKPGTIPWYGDPYSLEDLIVYMYYGHKREHSAQIEAFRDLATREPLA
jgi:hypothetical protein